MKKIENKIVIVLSSDTYVRNYITTDAFRDLYKDHECYFLISNQVKNLNLLDPKFHVLTYSYDNKSRNLHYKIFNLLMRRYQNKSKSFKFRMKRLDYFESRNFDNSTHLVYFLKLLRRLALWLKSKVQNEFLSHKYIFPYYFKYLKNSLKVNNELMANIHNIKPSLIIFPSSAHEPESTDLVEIGRMLNIPTLMLVDNWDNLSSKSLLLELPSQVAVWGEQSVQHAIDIQGFKREQITPIGTPRFDEYFFYRNLKLENNFNFKYILFVGTSLEFDEAGALEVLNDVVVKNKNIFQNTKILYRPHPWRQGRDTILDKNLQAVIIDPQLSVQYTEKRHSADFQPDLSYYPGLIQNAEIVVGGLSSMLIESLIFKKCFAALVYRDGKSVASPHNVLNGYEHFVGLEKIEAIEYCRDKTHLDESIISLWKRRANVDFEKVDDLRRYYCYDDQIPYSQRLRKLCEKFF